MLTSIYKVDKYNSISIKKFFFLFSFPFLFSAMDTVSCGDKDFVTESIERVELFVASEVAKLHKEITTLKKKQSADELQIANMTVENRSLREKVDGLMSTVEAQAKEIDHLNSLVKHTTGEKKGEEAIRVIENAFAAGLNSVRQASSQGIDFDITPLLATVVDTLPNSCSTPQSRTLQLPPTKKQRTSATPL